MMLPRFFEKPRKNACPIKEAIRSINSTLAASDRYVFAIRLHIQMGYVDNGVVI